MIGEEQTGDEKTFTTANVIRILPSSSATSVLGKFSHFSFYKNWIFSCNNKNFQMHNCNILLLFALNRLCECLLQLQVVLAEVPTIYFRE